MKSLQYVSAELRSKFPSDPVFAFVSEDIVDRLQVCRTCMGFYDIYRFFSFRKDKAFYPFSVSYIFLYDSERVGSGLARTCTVVLY